MMEPTNLVTSVEEKGEKVRPNAMSASLRFIRPRVGEERPSILVSDRRLRDNQILPLVVPSYRLS
jgi:hypothetical protein